jgi:hypothetical protein
VLIRSDTDSISLPEFSLKLYVGPALYFCIVKCRDPSTRDDALRLLVKCQGDDPWGSAVTVALKEIVRIESEGSGTGQVIPNIKRIDSIQVTVRHTQGLVQLQYRRPGLMNQQEKNGDTWDGGCISFH